MDDEIEGVALRRLGLDEADCAQLPLEHYQQKYPNIKDVAVKIQQIQNNYSKHNTDKIHNEKIIISQKGISTGEFAYFNYDQRLISVVQIKDKNVEQEKNLFQAFVDELQDEVNQCKKQELDDEIKAEKLKHLTCDPKVKKNMGQIMSEIVATFDKPEQQKLFQLQHHIRQQEEKAEEDCERERKSRDTIKKIQQIRYDKQKHIQQVGNQNMEKLDRAISQKNNLCTEMQQYYHNKCMTMKSRRERFQNLTHENDMQHLMNQISPSSIEQKTTDQDSEMNSSIVKRDVLEIVKVNREIINKKQEQKAVDALVKQESINKKVEHSKALKQSKIKEMCQAQHKKQDRALYFKEQQQREVQIISDHVNYESMKKREQALIDEQKDKDKKSVVFQQSLQYKKEQQEKKLQLQIRKEEDRAQQVMQTIDEQKVQSNDVIQKIFAKRNQLNALQLQIDQVSRRKRAEIQVQIEEIKKEIQEMQ